jgi:hypothetical protein
MAEGRNFKNFVHVGRFPHKLRPPSTNRLIPACRMTENHCHDIHGAVMFNSFFQRVRSFNGSAPSASSSRGSLSQGRRPLRLETMEERVLLDAGGLAALTPLESSSVLVGSGIANPPTPDIAYVDSDSTYDPALTDAGTTWSTAYPDLQDALDLASALLVDGDPLTQVTEIWVAEGTYVPSELIEDGIDESASFTLVDNTTIYGGFAGDETSVSQRQRETDISLTLKTILSGDIGVADWAPDNANTVLYANGLTGVGLNGLTITEANADGDNYTDAIRGHRGSGALYIYGSDVQLLDVAFIDNSASYYGAGMRVRGGSDVYINRSLFDDNFSFGIGAGINVEESNVDVKSTTFTNNEADSSAAIEYYLSTGTITSSIFQANYSSVSSSYNAGAVRFSDSQGVIESSAFSNNRSQGEGGALGIRGGPSDVTLVNTTITGNQADNAGGIVVDPNADLVMYNSIVSGNMGTTNPDIEGEYASSSSVVSSAASLFIEAPTAGADGVFATSDDTFGNLYPLPGSTMIDGGDNTPGNGIDLPSGDVTGAPRILDGDGDGNLIVDIGAFEQQTTSSPALRLTLYVDVDSTYDPAASDAGTSWATALPSLQTALDEAEASKTDEDAFSIVKDIWIAEGTYLPIERILSSDVFSMAFQLISDIDIYGGFAGTETAIDQRIQSADGSFQHETILSGELGSMDLYTVVYANNNHNIRIDGLTLSDADGRQFYNTNPVYGHAGAGAMYVYASSIELHDVSFIDNQCRYYGAGLHLTNDSNVVIRGGLFESNSATRDGSGIFAKESQLDVSGTLFTNNSASQASVLFLDNSDAVVSNSQFQSNARGLAVYGGADATVVNSMFTNNRTGGEGGAIRIADAVSTVSLINSTVSGNQADTGGALFVTAGGVMNVHNSIITGNTATTEPNISGAYTAVGSIIAAANPEFVRDPSPGVDGIIGTADDDQGDLHLLETSLAVNAGDATLLPLDVQDLDADGDVTEQVPIDFDGKYRVLGPQVDAGAYEYGTVAPIVLYVDADSTYDPAASDAGISWATAFSDLQDALDLAELLNNDADLATEVQEIWIAEGTYKPTPGESDPRFGKFTMLDNVSIYGGFAGGESDVDQRVRHPDGSFQNETILSGDIGVQDDVSDNVYSVVLAEDLDFILLSGLTIQDGYADGSVTQWKYGGGMYAHDSNVALKDVSFQNNESNRGGALYLWIGDLTIQGGVFDNNLASLGGAVWAGSSSSLSISDTLFSNNEAAVSGAVELSYAEGDFINCRFESNISSSNAGAVRAFTGGPINFTNSVFVNNYAGGDAGALNSSVESIIENCYFQGNSGRQGGAVLATTKPLLIANSVFSNNVARNDEGGALYISGLYHQPTLTNLTIFGNEASQGGGVYAGDDPILLQNSIVSGNIGGDLSGAYAGSNNIISSVVSLFVRDPSAGVDGILATEDDDFGDLHLASESIAANAGDASLLPADTLDLDGDGDVTELLPVDLDGNARIYGGILDIGAYESDALPFDYGDAPDPTYPTLLASDGARHTATGPTLGALRDGEPDGLPTANADGDDVNGTADEDGLLDYILQPGDKHGFMNVQASAAAYLNAWIDFDGNGIWEASEQVATDQTVNAGSTQIHFTTPLTAVPSDTYARLRLTSYDTGGSLLPTGPAADGEVEDHLVTIQGHVHLEGTTQNDSVRVYPGTPGGADHRVSINGVSTYYDATVYNTLNVDGLGGTDTLNVYGKPTDETVSFNETSVQVSESIVYLVNGESFESAYVYSGGGADVATMLGTSGNDNLYVNPTYSYLRGNSSSFLNYAKNFTSVTADVSSGAGLDRVYMYDGPGDDVLIAGATQMTVDYDSTASLGVNVTAIGFGETNAYAVNGGNDAATLTGSAGNDRFTARDLYGRMRGDDGAYIHYAEGFDQVTGDASGTTGTDVAVLFDAGGDDRLVAGEASAAIDLDATPGVENFNLIASGFDQTYAYAIRGGNDTAQLTGSDGNDRLTTKRTYSTLKRQDGSYFNYAAGFEQVTADVSAGAGDDLAFIYDEATDDEFIAGPTQATLDYDATGTPGIDTTAIGFGEVYAYAENGGNDTAILNGSSGVDKYYGLPAYSYIKAADESYFNYARGFDAVTANAVGAGDLAFLYGSNGDDVFNAGSASATFTLNPTVGGQVLNTAAAFDQVYGYASGGGTDTANLTGTTGADTLTADADWGILRSTGASDYFNYVRYFDEVFADPGDDEAGNDLLDDRGATYALNTDPGNGNVW